MVKQKFLGAIYDEKCNCPEEDLQKWYSSMHCNDTYNQIELDMQKVNSIDMKVLREKIISKYNQPHSYSICHYVIKDNKIYRKCYGQHVGFNMFSDAILLSLTRKVLVSCPKKDNQYLYVFFSLNYLTSSFS